MQREFILHGYHWVLERQRMGWYKRPKSLPMSSTSMKQKVTIATTKSHLAVLLKVTRATTKCTGSSATLKVFSLSLVFGSLNIMYLSVVFSIAIWLGVN